MLRRSCVVREAQGIRHGGTDAAHLGSPHGEKPWAQMTRAPQPSTPIGRYALDCCPRRTCQPAACGPALACCIATLWLESQNSHGVLIFVMLAHCRAVGELLRLKRPCSHVLRCQEVLLARPGTTPSFKYRRSFAMLPAVSSPEGEHMGLGSSAARVPRRSRPQNMSFS